MELAKHADRLRTRGYGVCSVSYDPVDVLRECADRRGIIYPMLSDPDSVIIRAFGLFNGEIEPGTRDYGVPHPAIFFVDRAGTVVRKYMEERYYHRRALATILADDGEPADLQTVWQVDGEQVAIQALALQREVDPGNRFALMVEVEPRPGLHVYAPGAGAEYRPLTLRMDAPPYVAADEPVYDAGGPLEVTGILSFQACSETVCWPPQDVVVTWALTLLPPDLERPPEHLRRERLVRRNG